MKQGFSETNINLKSLTDIKIGSMIIIGDGMSGKTQLLLTIGRLITNYLESLYYHFEGEDSDEMQGSLNELELAEKALGMEKRLSKSFISWAERYGFLVRYGRAKWDLSAISLETETIGLEDFEFVFPYYHKGVTYRIKLKGNDIGGQNIFDHFRTVIGKLAGSNDSVLVVFDKSRAISCLNSVNQIKNLVNEKESSRNIPKIILVGNKMDLESYIKEHRWKSKITNSFMAKLQDAFVNGKGSYTIPTLLGTTKGKERTVSYSLYQGRLLFPDLEAFIYNSIREEDQAYGRTMTNVNAKAIAREIAAQLIYYQQRSEIKKALNLHQTNPKDQRYNQLMTKFEEQSYTFLLNELGVLLFERRPLAIQYGGGLEFLPTKTDGTLDRIRSKWSKFGLKPEFVNEDIIYECVTNASGAEDFLKEVGDVFNTNALVGTGVLAIIEFIINRGIELSKKSDTDSSSKQTGRLVKKRKIRKF